MEKQNLVRIALNEETGAIELYKNKKIIKAKPIGGPKIINAYFEREIDASAPKGADAYAFGNDDMSFIKMEFTSPYKSGSDEFCAIQYYKIIQNKKK